MTRIWTIAAALCAAGCLPEPATSARSIEATAPDTTPAPVCGEAANAVLFATRIEALMSESRPSSCNGCHLTHVDLSDFVRGSACQSMACLIERELVDLDAPADSHLLRLIERGLAKDDPAVARAAQREHEAFSAWIAHSAICHAEVCGAVDDPCGVPVAPPVDAGVVDATVDATVADAAPVGPCAEATLLDAFEDRIWRWRGRCYHCHQGDGVELGPSDAPTWMLRGSSRESADGTYRRVIERGLIDLDHPDESLLLQKPLAEDAGGVEHGGGAKFRTLDDPAYLDFRAWVWTYAHCQNPSLDPPHFPDENTE